MGILRMQAQPMNPHMCLLRPANPGWLQPLGVTETSLWMMEQVSRGTRGSGFQRVLMGSAERLGLGGKPIFLHQQPLSPMAQAPKQT